MDNEFYVYLKLTKNCTRLFKTFEDAEKHAIANLKMKVKTYVNKFKLDLARAVVVKQDAFVEEMKKFILNETNIYQNTKEVEEILVHTIETIRAEKVVYLEDNKILVTDGFVKYIVNQMNKMVDELYKPKAFELDATKGNQEYPYYIHSYICKIGSNDIIDLVAEDRKVPIDYTDEFSHIDEQFRIMHNKLNVMTEEMKNLTPHPPQPDTQRFQRHYHSLYSTNPFGPSTGNSFGGGGGGFSDTSSTGNSFGGGGFGGFGDYNNHNSGSSGGFGGFGGFGGSIDAFSGSTGYTGRGFGGFGDGNTDPFCPWTNSFGGFNGSNPNMNDDES